MPQTMTESQVINQALFESLSGDGSMVKSATDAINDFTRLNFGALIG